MEPVIIGIQDLVFKPSEIGVRGFFYERYYFDISQDELDTLGEWKITGEGDLSFSACSEKKAWNKVSRLVEQSMRKLTHLLYNKPAIFINEAEGIPLIGSNEYGVIDRGSNILEIKPVTGCNFSCIYCSVDEGKNKKTHDYVVDKDYLVETAAWVAASKKHPVECNIGPQGEPLLYPKIVELIRDLKAIPKVEIISINTNGSLLSKQLIDKLSEAGLTRINLSLNAVDQDVANKLANTAYPLERIKEMIAYCQEKDGNKISVLLAPTLVPGFNDNQMEGLIKISRTIKSDYPTMGIQNFLRYPKGRNPVKQRSWEEFYSFISSLEEKTGASLKSKAEDFKIFDEKELTKPFHKGDVLRVKIV
ncbi:radical SAM protein, partial [Candidatus Woesearchaeota archaeon]|nr:radical SAM protein [Candidatus Woesearchaeota archaeon]